MGIKVVLALAVFFFASALAVIELVPLATNPDASLRLPGEYIATMEPGLMLQ